MLKPNFSFEKRLWNKGYHFVVGIDEVGRGAWAGPIVVGAVAFAPTPQIKNSKLKIQNWEKEFLDLGINDSKLLKPRNRERLAEEIKTKVLAWDVTEVGVSVINRIGIGKATEKAMRKTVKDIVKLLNFQIVKLKNKKSQDNHFFVLVDYFYVPYLRGVGKARQRGIKDGDKKSFSIAAASILAKVYRDKVMRRLGKKPSYKLYGWGRNKGYGTKRHQEAIIQYGLTRFHRKQFVETWKDKYNSQKD